ncbi:MAG: DNA repair protein RadC [Candidatus Spyradocola sp.]|nr:DNA repair protein RadC [Candidatus Spyradocola sp.]
MSEHDGHRKRLRERAARTGLEGFQPHEVLELLLSETIPRKDVNPLAHALIDRFGSFSGVLNAGREELLQVPGVGERTADHLSMQVSFFRYYRHDRWRDRPRLNTRRDAGEYCTTLFDRQLTESMRLICLDVHKAVLASEVLAVGTVDETPVYPRSVVECALRHHAHSAILVHNHPSGSLEPSQGDIRVTAQLEQALGVVGVELLDHIIVAGEAYASMRSLGLVPAGSVSAPPERVTRMRAFAPLPQQQAADSDDPPTR